MGDSENSPGTPVGYIMVENVGTVFGGCMGLEDLAGPGVKYEVDDVGTKRAGEGGSESLVAVDRCPEDMYCSVR